MRHITYNEGLFYHCDENGEFVKKMDNLYSLLELETKLKRNLVLLEGDIKAAEQFLTGCKKLIQENEDYLNLVKNKIGDVMVDYTSRANNSKE